MSAQSAESRAKAAMSPNKAPEERLKLMAEAIIDLARAIQNIQAGQHSVPTSSNSMHAPTGELTNDQIALLCDIVEHDMSKINDRRDDLNRLLSEGYLEPTEDISGTPFQPTLKARTFLSERGAGLNEA